jgi:CheY-like chemotaxis protein
LLVENDPVRIKWFKNQLRPLCTLTVCETAKQGMCAVEKDKFDMIFLDHDLDHRIFVTSEDPTTGYQVAKKIPETVNSKTPVIIHSFNPEGAENMRALLKEQATKMEYGSFGFAIDKSGKIRVVSAALQILKEKDADLML